VTEAAPEVTWGRILDALDEDGRTGSSTQPFSAGEAMAVG
jgi:hypothetical protein